MNNTFNKERYIELLKKDNDLRNKGSGLFGESIEEYRESLFYGMTLEAQVFYEGRNHYISLIEEYLSNKLNFFVFDYKLFEFRRANLAIVEQIKKDFDRLANISINLKSSSFYGLISDACEFCEVSDDSKITGLECRAFFEKILSEMKKCLD